MSDDDIAAGMNAVEEYRESIIAAWWDENQHNEMWSGAWHGVPWSDIPPKCRADARRIFWSAAQAVMGQQRGNERCAPVADTTADDGQAPW